jgi:hypothetical protein
MRCLLPLALCAATLACGGTAGTSTTTPAPHGVEALRAVLVDDDPRPAYELLSADVRAQVSFEEFAAQWKESGPERALLARDLDEAMRGEPLVGERARVTYADGRAVHVHREPDGWRMDAALVSRGHAATPHDALATFAEALAARDYEQVLGVLTERRREGIGRQVEGFARSLQQHVREHDRIDLVGNDRAEALWEDGAWRYKVVLRREGDAWRIDDIHISAR